MLVFLRYIGEAFAVDGLRALAGAVPLGSVLFEIAARALESSRRDQKFNSLREEIERTMQANLDEVRESAKAIAREVLAGHPKDQVLKLEHYLAQVPSVARQSMKRQSDPSGNTLLSGLDPRDPSQLESLLPKRLPRFNTGDPVPNSNQWQFVDLLGAGGFGEVWLARNRFVEQFRAFKFCLDDYARERLLKHEGELVKRVMAESQSERNSRHGIVPLVDAYLEGDTPWLAYEYVPGGDLAAIIRDSNKLAPEVRGERMLRFLAQLAEVIGRFHNFPQPIVHRDLKPANILWQAKGSELIMQVTDFGISQLAAEKGLHSAEAGKPHMCRGETLRGSHTPIYASPQQKRGLPPDVRDDVHALGIIGYQLLLGDLSVERPAGRWRKRVCDFGLSDAALDLLESCWDDDPEERPANAQVLAKKLLEVIQPSELPSPKSEGIHSEKKKFELSESPQSAGSPNSRADLRPAPAVRLDETREGLRIETNIQGLLEIRAPNFGNLDRKIRVRNWLQNEGGMVSTFRDLVELESGNSISKAFPSPVDGMLVSILAAKGAYTKAGDVLALLKPVAQFANVNANINADSDSSKAGELNFQTYANIFCEELAESGDKKVYFYPNIPEAKLQNALASIGTGVEKGSVIFLYDDTFFGGSRQGILLTSDRICWRNIFEPPKFFLLTNVNNVASEKGGFFSSGGKILVNNEKIDVNTGDNSNRHVVLARIIQRIVNVAKKK